MATATFRIWRGDPGGGKFVDRNIATALAEIGREIAEDVDELKALAETDASREQRFVI